eukprot:759911-Hanusia_phi.AAC.6
METDDTPDPNIRIPGERYKTLKEAIMEIPKEGYNLILEVIRAGLHGWREWEVEVRSYSSMGCRPTLSGRNAASGQIILQETQFTAEGSAGSLLPGSLRPLVS